MCWDSGQCWTLIASWFMFLWNQWLMPRWRIGNNLYKPWHVIKFYHIKLREASHYVSKDDYEDFELHHRGLIFSVWDLNLWSVLSHWHFMSRDACVLQDVKMLKLELENQHICRYGRPQDGIAEQHESESLWKEAINKGIESSKIRVDQNMKCDVEFSIFYKLSRDLEERELVTISSDKRPYVYAGDGDRVILE